MDVNKLKDYARLLVKSGLNVKENQIVVIRTPIEAYELVRLITKYAFEECKAKDVIVKYSDEVVEHERYKNRDADSFKEYPEYDSLFFNSTANAGACYLTLVGDDPDLMNDIDAKKMGNASRARNSACKPWRHALDTMKCQWCVAAVSTPKWANKVFPNDDQAVDKLWEAIFKVARVYGDPIENWNQHKDSFLKKMDIINHMDIESLHYTNSLGTDFTVELNPNYLFLGGGSFLEDNTTYYFPNVPTEELFCAPNRLKCDGKLVASMPLVHNGAFIDEFWFEFKDGKVVDFDAKQGREVIQSILDTDENASYLGEIALVPYDSPISNLNTVFYETLLDENASCHFALGKSYAECIDGGLEMTEEELLAHNMNVSLTHVDFMVGTKDLQIEAKCKSGETVKIFENGNFSSLFD